MDPTEVADAIASALPRAKTRTPTAAHDPPARAEARPPAASEPARPRPARDTAPDDAGERRSPFGDLRVKYFGKELPPRCELHGCWKSDDGATFYCTNFACNKHKHRRTKHTKYSRYAHLDTTRPHGAASPRAPAPPNEGVWPIVHFKCPSCASRNVDMRVLENRYVCGKCGYEWK